MNAVMARDFDEADDYISDDSSFYGAVPETSHLHPHHLTGFQAMTKYETNTNAWLVAISSVFTSLQFLERLSRKLT